MAQRTGRRLGWTLALLGLGLLLLPLFVLVAIRVFIQVAGEEAGAGMAVTVGLAYFFIAAPAGIGLLVASLFVSLRERFQAGRGQ